MYFSTNGNFARAEEADYLSHSELRVEQSLANAQSLVQLKPDLQLRKLPSKKDSFISRLSGALGLSKKVEKEGCE